MVHRHTRDWPPAERHGLTAQVRRASHFAAANIAEGAAVRGAREYRRHLNGSIGSLAEVGYALQLARDLGYMSHERWGEMEAVRDHAGHLTWGLHRAIGRRAASTI